MICVINYQMGNIGAIVNMLKKIGAKSLASSGIKDIEKADKLIFPGVGSFDAGINNLKKLNLIPALTDKVIRQKTPILGICLGMQLLARKSEEGVLNGLGWIDGEVKRFKFDNNGLKIPHMGWNVVTPLREDGLFKDMIEGSRFYFVHSYHFVCDNKGDILATTNYDYDFVSAVQKENIFGVQFHPEKSHKFGMKLLDNFVTLC